jgi:hypothetical protein
VTSTTKARVTRICTGRVWFKRVVAVCGGGTRLQARNGSCRGRPTISLGLLGDPVGRHLRRGKFDDGQSVLLENLQNVGCYSDKSEAPLGRLALSWSDSCLPMPQSINERGEVNAVFDSSLVRWTPLSRERWGFAMVRNGALDRRNASAILRAQGCFFVEGLLFWCTVV